jgi:hypothetical protein
MLMTTTWWRNLGGLLAACVLALLIVAPAIASAACVCDERPPSVVAYQTVEADQKHDSAPCKAACCLGGHCHHVGSMLDAPFEAIAAPAPAPAEHVMIPARALTSHTPSPLDDPPRG